MHCYIIAGGCERDEGGTYRGYEIEWGHGGKSKGELLGISTLK